jgi:hypothetical protein
MGRGPLTLAGQRRIDTWRRLWQDHGTPKLPMLLTDMGEVLPGAQALTWLAHRLPQQPTAAATVPAASLALERHSCVPVGRP